MSVQTPATSEDARTSDLPEDDRTSDTGSKSIGICSLVVIGFFWVSGGIYGNESLVAAAPPLVVLGFALLLPVGFLATSDPWTPT